MSQKFAFPFLQKWKMFHRFWTSKLSRDRQFLSNFWEPSDAILHSHQGCWRLMTHMYGKIQHLLEITVFFFQNISEDFLSEKVVEEKLPCSHILTSTQIHTNTHIQACTQSRCSHSDTHRQIHWNWDPHMHWHIPTYSLTHLYITLRHT